jgi:hypothetical protein
MRCALEQPQWCFLTITSCPYLGHVFCLPCLTSHFGYSPSCPKCRDRCSQTDILRLYLDESEQVAPPLATSDSSDLVDRMPRIEALSAKATELDIEATKEQLASVVTPGEILLLDLERHGGTDIQVCVLAIPY